jgi:hypothetical protein
VVFRFKDTSGNIGVASSTVTITPIVCDVDGDGDIDRFDIAAITAARGVFVGPGDRRDANGDGILDVLDARICAVRCTRTNCQ